MSRLIDVDKTKEVLTSLLYETARNNEGCASRILESIADYRLNTWVDLIPTVDTERHGKWIIIGNWKKDKRDSGYLTIFKCSCCHTPFIGEVDRYHYCPNCGAKIDEIEEGEVRCCEYVAENAKAI